jgi:hypothetical protein
VGHGNLDLFTITLLQNSDWLTHVVLTSRHNFDEAASDLWGYHNSVLVEEGVLVAATKHIASNDKLTSLEALQGSEVPKFVLIKGRYINTAGNENTL